MLGVCEVKIHLWGAQPELFCQPEKQALCLVTGTWASLQPPVGVGCWNTDVRESPPIPRVLKAKAPGKSWAFPPPPLPDCLHGSLCQAGSILQSLLSWLLS